MLILLFILTSICLTWVLFQAIQRDQIFGFWTRLVLDPLYKKSNNNESHRFLEMFLGGCYKCFSNFIAQLTFSIYLILFHVEYGWWNILVYFLYVTVSIVGSVWIGKILSDKE